MTSPFWRAAGFQDVIGQGLRFGLAGGVVAVVYVASTSLLAEAFGVDFEIAITIGFVLAIVAHFALQRWFVWVHTDGFAVSLRHQALRYLAVAGTQYGLTVAVTSILPEEIHLSTEIVYLCCVVLLTAANFLVFRTIVFHAADPADDQ